MLFGTGGWRKGASKRRTPQDKARTVMEFIDTGMPAAELSCKHNVSPTAFQDWKDKFTQGGRQALLNKGDKIENHAKEMENLKCIIGEITAVNDVLKKTLEGTRR